MHADPPPTAVMSRVTDAKTATTKTGEGMIHAISAHGADGADGADRSAEGRVLLHVWMIEPHMARRHLQLLGELFDGISDQPGFVSARILESPHRSSIAAIVEMRTVEDRQRLEQLPQVHDVLYQLRPGANLVVHLYHEVARFDAHGSAVAAELG